MQSSLTEPPALRTSVPRHLKIFRKKKDLSAGSIRIPPLPRPLTHPTDQCLFPPSCKQPVQQRLILLQTIPSNAVRIPLGKTCTAKQIEEYVQQRPDTNAGSRTHLGVPASPNYFWSCPLRYKTGLAHSCLHLYLAGAWC